MTLIVPAYLITVAALTLLVTIVEAIERKKVNKITLIISIINLLVVAVLSIAFYYPDVSGELLFQQIYFAYSIFNYALLGLITIFYILKLVLENRELKLFTNSIMASPWKTFVIVNRKNKIKKISADLLEELDMEPKEVLKKDLFEVINKSLRIIKINNALSSNKEAEQKYYEQIKLSEENDLNVYEINFYNYMGELVILHLTDQPIYTTVGYKGRVLIGEKKTDFDLLGVEKKLKLTEEDLDILREQYIATLEITQEGLSFVDIDENSQWISESLKEALGFYENNISLDDFRRLMHPEDLQKYLLKLNQLTSNNPSLKVTYRLYSKGVYQWYQENLKRIFSETRAMIVSSINPIKTKHFMQTNIDVLDELKGENDLIISLQNLISDSKFFHLALVKVGNLKEVNEKHDRAIGNLILAQYVQKIRSSFVTDSGDIFRLTGSTFAIILSDRKKMGLLKSGTEMSDDYLNMRAEFGSVQAELVVYAGISVTQKDGFNANEILAAANKALKVAENPKYKGHICYYSDIN